jgi:hypothetical protein
MLIAKKARSGFSVDDIQQAKDSYGKALGLELSAGYQTKLTALSTHEAEALPFAEIGMAALALGLDAAAEAARLKVFDAGYMWRRTRLRKWLDSVSLTLLRVVLNLVQLNHVHQIRNH